MVKKKSVAVLGLVRAVGQGKARVVGSVVGVTIMEDQCREWIDDDSVCIK